MAAKAWSERLSGKKENEGVYFGKQNTLINRVQAQGLEDGVGPVVGPQAGPVVVGAVVDVLPAVGGQGGVQVDGGSPTRGLR